MTEAQKAAVRSWLTHLYGEGPVPIQEIGVWRDLAGMQSMAGVKERTISEYARDIGYWPYTFAEIEACFRGQNFPEASLEEVLAREEARSYR